MSPRSSTSKVRPAAEAGDVDRPKLRAIGFVRGEVKDSDERREEIENLCEDRGFQLVRVVAEEPRGSTVLPIVLDHRKELVEAIDAIAVGEAAVIVAAGIDLAGDDPDGLSKVISRVEAVQGRLLIDGHIMV